MDYHRLFQLRHPNQFRNHCILLFLKVGPAKYQGPDALAAIDPDQSSPGMLELAVGQFADFVYSMQP
jgi:hypothetical protein